MRLSSLAPRFRKNPHDIYPDTGGYHECVDAYSRKIIEESLQRNGWNQTRAAEELGLQRTYLTKLLRQKDISGRQPDESSAE